MLAFDYQLTKEDIRDMNGYLAIHDKKIQQKAVSLSVAFAILLSVITLLIMGIKTASLFVILIEALLVFLIFPKIYWRVVFSRISKKIDENTDLINFHRIHVEMTDSIAVKSDETSFKITSDDIITYDFTKTICMIFYRDAKGKNNTLIIPVSTIGDNLQETVSMLGRMASNVNQSADSKEHQ